MAVGLKSRRRIVIPPGSPSWTGQLLSPRGRSGGAEPLIALENGAARHAGLEVACVVPLLWRSGALCAAAVAVAGPIGELGDRGAGCSQRPLRGAEVLTSETRLLRTGPPFWGGEL